MSDPEILGGTPCFRGARVPVESLFNYLEPGDTLEEFLDCFRSVTSEAAIAALEKIQLGGHATPRLTHGSAAFKAAQLIKTPASRGVSDSP